MVKSAKAAKSPSKTKQKSVEKKTYVLELMAPMKASTDGAYDGMTGGRIEVPKGMETVESLAVEMLRLHEEGHDQYKLKEKFGADAKTVARLCDLAALLSNERLNKAEKRAAREAMDLIVSTGRIKNAAPAIEQLAVRVWGSERARSTRRRSRIEAERMERFWTQINYVAGACAATPHVERVLLTPAERDKALADLATAARHISKLRRKLKGASR